MTLPEVVWQSLHRRTGNGAHLLSTVTTILIFKSSRYSWYPYGSGIRTFQRVQAGDATIGHLQSRTCRFSIAGERAILREPTWMLALTWM